MGSVSTAKAPIRQRIVTETKEFVVIGVYLCICFIAVIYLKAAILQAHGIAFAPFGLPLPKP